MRVYRDMPALSNSRMSASPTSPSEPQQFDLFEPRPPDPPILVKKKRLKAAAHLGLIAVTGAASLVAGVGTMLLSGAPGLAVGLVSGAAWGITAGRLASNAAVWGVGQATSTQPSDNAYKWGHALALGGFVALGATLGMANFEYGSGGFYMVASALLGAGGGFFWGERLIFGPVMDDNQMVPYRNQHAQEQYQKELQVYEEQRQRYEADIAGQAIQIEELEDHVVVGDVVIPRH